MEPRLLAVLAALTAIGPVSIDLYLPALPQLSRSLSASQPQGQLTITTCLVGLAVGQLAAGPISDIRGRRLTLIVGAGGYTLASLACAAAPSIGLVIGIRLAQGIFGGACLAVSRALVADRYPGAEAARILSMLMALAGFAPVLAPLIGAQILQVGTWRTDLVVVAAFGLVTWIGATRYLPATVPTVAPSDGRTIADAAGRLCRDRAFTGHLFAAASAFAALFTYIAASPFVLEGHYGFSPAAFSFDFAVNGAGLAVVSYLGSRAARRAPTGTLVAVGLAAASLGSALLIAATTIGAGPASLLAGFFLTASSIGLIVPNATAQALAGLPPESVGLASGLLGSSQFLFGGMVAPLVQSDSGASMALLMAGLLVAGSLSHRSSRDPHDRRRPRPNVS